MRKKLILGIILFSIPVLYIVYKFIDLFCQAYKLEMFTLRGLFLYILFIGCFVGGLQLIVDYYMNNQSKSRDK